MSSFIWDVWRMPSYMLGSEGEAAVVDPQRDVELYLTAAAEQGERPCYMVSVAQAPRL